MDNRTKVHRVSKSSNFSVIHNEVLRRKDLSWKAKGIMAYVLSLPDDWVIYLEELERNSTDGKASFRSGWNELKERGYVERKPIRDKGKIIAWQTIINENVGIKGADLLTDYQQVDNLQVDNLQVDNRKLLSTYNTNYLNKLNTEEDANSTEDKKPKKSKHGEFNNVLLTEQELEKLKEKYPNDYLQRIERVSGYVASTGKSYKSHYATIISWARKDEQDQPKKKVVNSDWEKQMQELME